MAGVRPVLLFLALVPVLSMPELSAQPPLPRPPVTRASSQQDTLHGQVIADPYRWLEDDNSAETAEWVRAQNAVTFGYLEQLPGRAVLRDRLTALFNYARYGIPVRRGGRYFWSRNDGLQDQAVLYWQGSLGGEARVLLDPNVLSADGTTALTVSAPSPDGRLLGYGTAAAGSDWNEFRVREVDTGRDLPDRLRWVKFSGLSWTRDNRGFFYSRYPEPRAGGALSEANLNQVLSYHRLGTPQSEDVLVLGRPDQPEWGFSGEVTEDGRWLVVTVWHGTDRRNRVYLVDLGDPMAPRVDGPVTPLLDDFDAGYQVLGNAGSLLLVQTDLEAPRGRIIAIDLARPGRESWRTVVPQAADVLQGSGLVGGRLVAQYLRDVTGRLLLFGLDGAPAGEVRLPGPGTVAGFEGREDDPELFFAFTSFLDPVTIFRADVRHPEPEVFRAPAVAFDRDRYETRQVFYPSKDGTRVPLFLTHRKGIRQDGRNPVLLTGYGGFNISLTPAFSTSILPWLELGGVYAVANLRGGSEYGEDWHAAGMRERKQTVFDDFIAAAEWLVAERYTSPDRLAIQGGSNGGLLVGAAMTQRPDLFGVALPAVGVMDMLRFHRFTIGHAWVSEYGSADDPALFEVLRGYSPLHNLRPGTDYPATLVTTADHDDRVVPAHSFKFAAALQAASAGRRPALIRIETRAGHGAGTPVAKVIEQAADILAFTAHHLGVPVVVP